MSRHGVIYQYGKTNWEVITLPNLATTLIRPAKKAKGVSLLGSKLGIALIAFALGGVTGPLSTPIRMESAYMYQEAKRAVLATLPSNTVTLPPSVPKVYTPLVTPDGASIDPVNKDFSLVVPKIGINASVLPAVNPANPGEYLEALKKGIAHASTSFFPDQDGTVYLFSHSTSYDWFVRDLNAVFYQLKNLDTGDRIVLFYKGKQYTYQLTEKRVVSPGEISYLTGQPGRRSLILQTCWPPGSTTQRLLIFADLIEDGSAI